MEEIEKFISKHKKKIIIFSGTIAAIGIGLKIYSEWNKENEEVEEEIKLYNEEINFNKNIIPFFKEYFKKEEKYIKNTKYLIQKSLNLIYSISFVYLISKIQINILNQFIFLKEKNLNFKLQESFLIDFFDNKFKFNFFDYFLDLIKKYSNEEFENNRIELFNLNQFDSTILNIRSKIEDELIEFDFKNDENCIEENFGNTTTSIKSNEQSDSGSMEKIGDEGQYSSSSDGTKDELQSELNQILYECFDE